MKQTVYLLLISANSLVGMQQLSTSPTQSALLALMANNPKFTAHSAYLTHLEDKSPQSQRAFVKETKKPIPPTQ